MKIVIDIPEEVYNRCKEYRLQCGEAEVLESSVARGTLLPKGHGDLVDLTQMMNTYWDGNYMEIHKDDLQNITVIIKAESEE